MLIHLHKQATTTPKLRAAIQASDAPASVLAERFGTTPPCQGSCPLLYFYSISQVGGIGR